ncbi:ParB/RepB/Spo0J family partition protein [Arcanobacterium bovis]|uniref:ParB/RepB/Spo0J family partition protein n=1 Tax=Arcanobacterium bovis TaxID=2529275 RepID=A0A4V2KR07_9ACTO|nr:ParB/RepB/Spo0J family partition protein [Arcanobacterium bovis]TBW21027.1 ParB/RepB/Spo0J family partition protein [Arcanobacterium bovis]
MAEKRRGLGRGIGALIPESQTENKYSPIDVFFNNPRQNDAVPANSEGSAIVGSEVRKETGVGIGADTGATTATTKTNAVATGQQSKRATASDSTKKAKKSTGKAPVKKIEQQVDGSAGQADQNVAEVSVGAKQVKDRVANGAPTKHEPATVSRETDELVPVPGATFGEIPVGQIIPNTKQPRQVFDEDDLQELADSIKEVGVLQPIVVRPLTAPINEYPNARYELIMGERRWRASQLAGNEVVPAVVRRTEDGDLLRDALLENLHRAQLNALEEAAAYQQLLDDFGCTQEELSRRIARSRPQISNTLRLLKLPALVQRRVAAGVISAGHARALLGLPDPAAMERVAQKIVAEGLSVRAVEELVAMGDETQPKTKRTASSHAQAPELADIAAQLGDTFDTRVKITMGQRKGKITIDFASMDDLERILDVIKRD